MLRLKRHIVTEILEVFFAVIVALMLIMISFQFAKLLGQAAAGKISGVAIYQLVALQAINLFVLLAPFAFFIAVLIGLSRLASSNELIAMKSVGYSEINTYQALFFLAIPLAVIMLFISLYILPKVIRLNYELTQKARKESEISIIQPGSFRTIGGNTTVFVAEIESAGFSGFFIRQNTEKGETLITARTGSIDEKDNERYIKLNNGNRYHQSKDKKSQLMFFERFEALLPNSRSMGSRTSLKATPTHELFKNNNLSAKVELQRRTTTALSILLLAFLAPLLIQVNPREKQYGKFVGAILAYAIYANSQHIVQSLVESQRFPLIPGMYITHIIFLFGIFTWLMIKSKNRLGWRKHAR